MADIITLGTLDLNDVTTYGTINVNAPDPQRDETTRIVTLTISVGGVSQNAYLQNVRAIRSEINRASQAYNAARYEDFVSLGLGLANGAEVVSFTVKRGWVDDLTGAFDHAYSNRYGTESAPIVVTLECEALGIGDAIIDTVSGTISGDTAGWTYYRANVPGDEPAYAVMTLTDTSSSSSVLNRIHVGHLSRQALVSGDFGGWYDLGAMTGATLNTIQPDAMGGDHVSRSLIALWAWTDLATVSAPAPLAANSGLFHVYARVRDAQTVPQPVRNLRVASKTTGVLPLGSYMVVVAAWGASRSQLAAVSEPVYFTIDSTLLDGVNLAWDAPLGYTPTDHSIYWKRVGQDWQYLNSGSASTTYSFTAETGGTVEEPPSQPVPLPARFRMRYGFESGTVMHTAAEVETRISNDQWEVIHLGTIQLPPQTTAAGGSVQPWQLQIQAFNPTDFSRTVYADAICLIPAESHSVMAEYEGLNLVTKRKWLLASDRSGGRTALLQNTADDTEEGHLSMRGVMRVGPGDTKFVFIPLEANGVSDVSNSQFTVDLTLYPAYRSITGEA